MKEWITENLLSIFTTLFGGSSFIALLIEKKKRKIEEKQLSTDALKSMQDAYDKFTEDSLNRYNSLKEELNLLKKQLGNVNYQLTKERDKYSALKSQYDTLQSAYESLKREFNLMQNQKN